MSTYKLSPSSLHLFQECPRCFWYEKHDKWKRPSGPFPSLPSGMDGILKNHFDYFRDRGELPPQLSNRPDQSNQGGDFYGMKLFGRDEHEKALLKEWRNNLKGIRWKDESGNELFGAVDNILRNKEKLIVLDYKTRGFPLKSDTHEHYRNQLDIYNFLLKQNGYDVENYGFLLFYIPDRVLPTGEVIFNTHLKKMEAKPENAQKLFIDALGLLNGECPKKNCEWCSGR